MGKWIIRRMPALLLLTLLLAVGGFMIAVAVTPLPEPSNPAVTEIVDRSGGLIARLFVEQRVEVPMVQIPQHAMDAIVAVEDDRFFSHRGIDPVGIGRAALRNLQARKVVEGGSTLSQQLARNLYLTHQRTVARKLKEAVLAVRLEATYSKRELIGMYWNTVYLGAGTYGLEVAAQTYFGKSAPDLTLAEAALLAGLPRNPEYYSPFNNPQGAVGRRNLVLAKMQEQGRITAPQAAAAMAEPLKVAVPKPAAARAPAFVDAVTRELAERFLEVAAHLYHGGYRIETSLDPVLQERAEQAVRDAALPASGRDATRPQAALVALDARSGQVLALVGGREEGETAAAPARNRALEPRQAGSTFKPFLYARLLEERSHTAASMQPDEPVAFQGARPGQSWRPLNHGNRYSGQPLSMREALRRSVNVVAARWMAVAGPAGVIELARRLGIGSPLPADLTLALGSGAVTPLELTAAYAPFANGGLAVQPQTVTRILDRHGRELARVAPVSSRALEPGVAFIVTDMLTDVLGPEGTASGVRALLGERPAAGKTGTSDESRDAWFVGYTPEVVAGVWVGYDDGRPAAGDGSSLAAPIWARFMAAVPLAVPAGAPGWAPPPDVTEVLVCAITGLLPNASCPVRHEWFLSGTEPEQVDPTVHWNSLLPDLPGVPLVPAGTLPPKGDD